MDQDKQIMLGLEKFINENVLDENISVHENITDSWKRSRSYLQSGQNSILERLSEDALQLTQEKHKAAHKTVFPIIREYESFYLEKHGVLAFFSDDGIMLDCIGDLSILGDIKLGIGDNFSEKSKGTNAVGICLHTKEFSEVAGAEHFNKAFRNLFTCAHPLWGGKYHLMGVLAVILPLSQHSVENAVCLRAISASINHLHHVNDLLNDQESVLELLNYGVVILNSEGHIKALNEKACFFFDLPREKMVMLGHVTNYISNSEIFLNLLNEQKTVNREEVSFKIGKTSKSFVLSSSIIAEDKGMIFTLLDAKQAQKNAIKTIGFKASYTFDDLIGNSDGLLNAIHLSKIASQSTMTTLLLGESGTGKELFAHSIHNESQRASKPFVVINCGAIPRDLIQSELFGYENGAFTGAMAKGKIGKFELADGGTIFLDEIGEMPMDSQVSLLRFIQSKEVIRVGGTNVKHVDVRIISATNKNLEKAVENGTFRSDLFYRLCVFTVNIPALRFREEDVKLLIEHFTAKYSQHLNKNTLQVSPSAMELLCSYQWPGNVRELENVIEFIVNTTQGNTITEKYLPNIFLKESVQTSQVQHMTPKIVKDTSLVSKERQAILDVLELHKGNIRLCAKALGIARSALYSKMTKFSIDYSSYRQ